LQLPTEEQWERACGMPGGSSFGSRGGISGCGLCIQGDGFWEWCAVRDESDVTGHRPCEHQCAPKTRGLLIIRNGKFMENGEFLATDRDIFPARRDDTVVFRVCRSA
jgi:hypothetical protein